MILIKFSDLQAGRYTLDKLTERDLTIWASFFNDQEVVKYTRHAEKSGNFDKITPDTQRKYLELINDNPHRKLQWAIRHEEKLIGVVSLSHGSEISKICSIEILIGDKSYWGTRVATKVIEAVRDYAFLNGVRKLTAGADSRNIGCIKAFERCGFVQEGCLKKHDFIDGTYGDTILMGLVR